MFVPGEGWWSETFDLPSKMQLKAWRVFRWREACLARRIFLELGAWWLTWEVEAEEEAWIEVDVLYEEQKAELLAALLLLEGEELLLYFSEIGLDPVRPQTWLAPSPAS